MNPTRKISPTAHVEKNPTTKERESTPAGRIPKTYPSPAQNKVLDTVEKITPKKRKGPETLLRGVERGKRGVEDIVFRNKSMFFSEGIMSIFFENVGQSKINDFWKEKRPFCFAVSRSFLDEKKPEISALRVNAEVLVELFPEEEIVSTVSLKREKIKTDFSVGDLVFFFIDQYEPKTAYLLGDYKTIKEESLVTPCLYGLFTENKGEDDVAYDIPYSIRLLALLCSHGHIAKKNESLAENMLGRNGLSLTKKHLDYFLNETPSPSFVRFLLSAGANPNSEDGYLISTTPLQKAVMGRDLELAKALLDSGADINLTTKDTPNKSPWDKSIEYKPMHDLLARYRFKSNGAKS